MLTSFFMSAYTTAFHSPMNKHCLLFNTCIQHIFATGTQCHRGPGGREICHTSASTELPGEGEQKVGLPSTWGDHRGGVDTHAHCPFPNMGPGLGGAEHSLCSGNQGFLPGPKCSSSGPFCCSSFRVLPHGCPSTPVASPGFSAVDSCHDAANTWRNTAL